MDEIQRPDGKKEIKPSNPPIPTGYWNFHLECGLSPDCTHDSQGRIHKLHGHPAVVEDSRMLFSAEYIEFDEDAQEMHAKGGVYYHSFEKNEKIWCDEMWYHTERGNEHGKFVNVVGETQPRIITKPGILTSHEPFHFEGEWAERLGAKYILYKGWVTDCTMPDPWWRMTGPKFDIIPHVRAIAHGSTFRLRGIPLFYFPWFYRPLEREPRKSGFLLPEPGHSSVRGFTLAMGYFWAINRSYDVTYRAEGFTSGSITHHAEFRGKPKEGTDFDMIFFGAQDHSTTPGAQTYSGFSLTMVGHSDLGNGWTARGNLNYISSFRFQQDWTQSFNEAVGSEIHSTGFIDKNWSTFTLDTVASRTQNFQTSEIAVTDPTTNQVSYVADAVTIRKLPEVQFSSRDHDIVTVDGLPLWFSFESSSGLLFRSEPFFDANNNLIDRFQTSAYTNRSRLAPHLTTAFHLGDFHLVPSVGFEETIYSESQEPYLDHYRAVGTDIVRSARDFSLDLVFPTLERVYKGKSFLGDKLKHVIEPRATYRYVTGIGTEFNRFIRFDENDLQSNTNEVEIALANRFYAKKGNTVREVFTWEVAQKRYFDPTFGGALVSGQRNVFESTADLTGYAFLVGPRSTSPVVSTFRASPINGLNIQWQTDYDPRVRAIVNSTMSVDYRWKKYVISGGNNEVHNNPLLTPYANQFRGRVGYGDTNHRGWNAAVDFIYDYRQQVLLYTTTQVTYNTDCCGLSVQYRRYNVGIRDETLEYFSFSIANIGNFGNLKKQDRLF
ncbi:MAG: LPS assembly protein LptD [Bryobacteraceae bacterium]